MGIPTRLAADFSAEIAGQWSGRIYIFKVMKGKPTTKSNLPNKTHVQI